MKKLVLLISLLISIKQANAQFCFTVEGTPYSAGSNPAAIITADFNKDGSLDLAVANQGSDNISVLFGNGIGGFGSTATYLVGSSYQPLFICTADFNGDGNLDLATANSGVNRVSVLFGSSSGAFSLTPPTFTIGGDAFGICAADFNGDGYIDLATANDASNTVSILLGNGAGGFGSLSNLAVGTGPYSICTGDFNHDGKIDLATANDGATTSNNVSILINASTSTVTATFSAATYVTTGNMNPRSIISYDYNGDSNPDLAVTNYGSNNVNVLKGNGAGGFSLVSNTSINGGGNISAPRCAINGDFNNDGTPDLAVADYGISPSSSPFYVSFILNSTSPAVQNISLTSSAQNPHGICSGDFNGDGALDLAVANDGTNNISILLNTSPLITFSTSTSAICHGSMATIVASGSNTYTWSPTVTTVSTGVSTETITTTPTVSTTYTVTGNNSSCGNTATNTITISVNPLPNVSIASTSNTICVGASATLTPGPASTYTWSTNAHTGNIVVSPTVTTTYSVSGTSLQGCVNSASYTLGVFASPTVTVNSATVCTGHIASLSAGGAFTYTWSTGSTNTVISPSPTVATNYTVTGTDVNSCTNTAVSTVLVNPLPTVLINGMNNGSTNLCMGSNAILTASGASTYTWSANAGSATTTMVSVSPTTFTTYFVNGTDINGCGNSNSMGVLIYALPGVSVNSATVCAGATATLTANGASTYTWNTGTTGVTITPSPTVTTTYTVTGTNANSCTNTATGIVTEPANVIPNICMVSTDSFFVNNIIYWDRTQYNNVDSFIVYRLSSGVYLRIGAVSNDSNQLTDTKRNIGGPNGGDPNVSSWFYKIAIKDTCGTISTMSPYHQTVNFQRNNQNLSWNAYAIESPQTNPVDNYAVWRDSLGIGDWHIFVNTSALSTNDNNYASYPDAIYRVDATPFTCIANERLSGNNSTDAAKVKSHSNTYNNRTSGMKQFINNNEINIYPNPNNGSFSIRVYEYQNTIVEVYNTIGQKVLDQDLQTNLTQLNLANFSDGMYQLRVLKGGILVYQTKVVKQE